MINYEIGDLLSITKGFLPQGCNTQGKMGSGIALSIKNKWPEVYQAYLTKFKEGHNLNGVKLQELEMGTIIPVSVNPDIVVINAMTQRFYTGHRNSVGGREVDYDAIAKCFEEINKLPELYPDVEPILNFPLIGAGLAKGNWRIISTIIDETITSMEKVLWTLDAKTMHVAIEATYKV